MKEEQHSLPMNCEQPEPIKKKCDAIPDEKIGEALTKYRRLQYRAAQALGCAPSTVSATWLNSSDVESYKIIATCVQGKLSSHELVSLSRIVT